MKSQKKWYICLILYRALQARRGAATQQAWTRLMFEGILEEIHTLNPAGSPQIHRSARWWRSLLDSTLQGIPNIKRIKIQNVTDCSGWKLLCPKSTLQINSDYSKFSCANRMQ
ncbi:hypothetical protein AVEN_206699-1 [Araneus ventricosus]|uniref:Uncharacterized protein n=1 Tax=Araneus ventricosus TaxID=182803 RepID=A0A4Y2I8T4_ARAVE|nr:hypothetical protein AVEN_206699-1 [Araneus ventricosus]